MEEDRGRVPGPYETAYEESIRRPETFWARAAEQVDWDGRWETVLDPSASPSPRWFTGGSLNTCHNAVDRHVQAGRGDDLAVIYDSPVAGVSGTLTYRRLLQRVERCAGALRGLGVEKGDRVVIYMPMIPETLVAMLACARIGAVHSVVFGGFAAQELAVRIEDARPKVIVWASCGIEPNRVVPYKPLVDAALEYSEWQVEGTIVLQRPQAPIELVQGRDSDWEELERRADPAPCIPLAATDPLYILYTSGTTGKPKGVVRDNGGHAVALVWSMKYLYDVGPGEVFWAASDMGWVVGHSYIVYGPLLVGATTVIYEGKPVGTPDRRGLLAGRPGLPRQGAVHGTDGDPRHPAGGPRRRTREGLRPRFAQGALPGRRERLDPDTYHWATTVLGVPGGRRTGGQTETGGAICANCLGLEHLPMKPGSPTRPVPGTIWPCSTWRVGPSTRRLRASSLCACAAARHAADPVAERRSVLQHLPGAVPGLLLHR